MAKSIHHARVLIKQRHVRVGKRMVDIPSFMVRLDSEKHIEFALTSPFGAGRAGNKPSPLASHTPISCCLLNALFVVLGRVRRKTMKSGGKGKKGDDGDKAEAEEDM